MNGRFVPTLPINLVKAAFLAFVLCGARAYSVYAADPVDGADVIGSLKMVRAPTSAAWDMAQAVVYLVPEKAPVRPGASASPIVIHQKNATFNPPFAVAIKGQTVQFLNDDSIDHNVFSYSKVKKFDLGIYPKGESKSLTFEEEGPVLIFCSIHEFMNGIVYVVPAVWYGLTDSQGHFSIPHVPVGRYQVRMWHASLPKGSQYVEVRSLNVQNHQPVHLDILLGQGGAAKKQ